MTGQEIVAVAKQVGGALIKMEPEFRAVLPAHIDPAAFRRVAQTAIAMNDDLQACTPKSLIAACTKCAEAGLLPDGEMGALVAYSVRVKRRGQDDTWEKQAKFMPMVRGIRDLVQRSGMVKDWKVRIVRSQDQFEYVDGDVERLLHVPAFEDDDGIVKVYSIAYLENGEISRHVMTIAQVEAIRKRSRSPGNGPWVTDYDEMVKKTCLRQHSKSLPKAKDDKTRAHIAGAIRGLDEAEAVIDTTAERVEQQPRNAQIEASKRLSAAIEDAGEDEGGTPPEAPKATRKRRTTAERIADTEAELKGGKAAASEQPEDDDTFADAVLRTPARQASPEYEDEPFPGDLPSPSSVGAAAVADDEDEARFERKAYESGWRMYFDGRLREAPKVWTPRMMTFWYQGWDAARKQNADNPTKVQSDTAQERELDRVVGRVFS